MFQVFKVSGPGFRHFKFQVQVSVFFRFEVKVSGCRFRFEVEV